MVLAIALEEGIGQGFNITDGIGVPCSEYFGRLAEMNGGRWFSLPTRVAEPVADVVGGLMRRLGMHSDLSRGTMRLLNRPGTYSIEKAQKLLGYQPLVTIDEGMATVRAWAEAEGLAKAGS